MKPTHLLTSVAVAAMLCGTASAQYIQSTTYAGLPTSSANNSTAATNAAERLVIASHVDISTLPSSSLTIGLVANGATSTEWDNPGAATFTVNLANAVFSSSVNNASLTGEVGGAGAATAGCLAADISVSSNGTVGSSTVSFNIANIAACGGQLNFSSANGVQLSGTGANFTTTLTRQLGNTSINGGSGTTAGAAGAFVQQAPAISFSGPTTLPTRAILLAAPTYTTMAADAGTFQLGVTVWKTTIAATAVDVRRNLEAIGGGSQPIGAGLVSAATAALGLTSTTGLDRATSTIGGGAGTFGATNAANISSAFAGAGTTQLNVVVATNAIAAPIVSQTVSVTPALTFAAASGVPATTYSAVNVGRLVRKGQQTPVFSWVGDGRTTSATSVFRHTNMGTTIPTVRFILSNSSAGASFDGEYVIPAASLINSNGEVVTNSLTLSNVAGNFGRADVSFIFDRSVADGKVDTQRFVQAPNGSLAAGPQQAITPVNNTGDQP